ncbi:MAG: HEPN domain-containing protein [Sulfolobales archaeon]
MAFLKNAEYLYSIGQYDLAMFSLEQYCQLILKYKLLIKTRTYLRTHSITYLPKLLSSISQEVNTLLENDENSIILTKIEDAYISSRHLPRRYDEREVKVVLRFV